MVTRKAASQTLSEKAVARTIKRTIKDYRKTLRRLASGPGRAKRG